MDTTARQIRQRIVKIIISAFISVTIITLMTVIIGTGVSISSNLGGVIPLGQFPLVSRLEGYYIGQGSWDGVHVVFDQITPIVVSEISLLDKDGNIVIDQGTADSPAIGTRYQDDSRDSSISLSVDGQKVGSLVFDQVPSPSRFISIILILWPVGLIALFLAFLAILLVVLLSRRFVTPLADVIAASRAVADGKLGTRVEVQGAQDLVILTDSFNQMASKLERSDHERRNFLADIAHELRTPISGIRGRLEGMLDGVYPSDEKHLSLALKSTYLLERLVEDLRVLTMAESRQITLDRKDTDLNAMSVHAIEMFSAEALEKGIDLFMEPYEGDAVIFIDPQRTEQVIGNLVSNALRYTPEGGKVWIKVEKTTQRINISVCDNGPGVPEEDISNIFNRFWRKDKSRTRSSGGSGLGLAIAKQLVEAQGGSISAENLSAGGMKVSIEFPVIGSW